MKWSCLTVWWKDGRVSSLWFSDKWFAEKVKESFLTDPNVLKVEIFHEKEQAK